jgi:hypothetical protein
VPLPSRQITESLVPLNEVEQVVFGEAPGHRLRIADAT